jgi:hypothetical protein
MKQSNWASFLESAANIIVGLGIALGVNVVMLNWYGFAITTEQNLAMGGVMTVASLMRSFGLRRLFEALHIRRPLSPFMQAVIAECFRQREQEGWTIEHDDAHESGDLARAGAAYLYAGSLTSPVQRERLPRWYDKHGSDVLMIIKALWPWDWDWWKPSRDDRRRDLVRGCALGVSEGEKFDRNRRKGRVITPTITTDSGRLNRLNLAHNKSRSEHSGTSG